MDGVKTLHPKIHGGLLARRDLDTHVSAMKRFHIDISPIWPLSTSILKETILKPDVTYADAVENIDIGGPSMLRSAAKNHASCTVVVESDRLWDIVLTELKMVIRLMKRVKN